MAIRRDTRIVTSAIVTPAEAASAPATTEPVARDDKSKTAAGEAKADAKADAKGDGRVVALDAFRKK